MVDDFSRLFWVVAKATNLTLNLFGTAKRIAPNF